MGCGGRLGLEGLGEGGRLIVLTGKILGSKSTMEPSDNDRKDIPVFHHKFLPKSPQLINQAALVLKRNAATIAM
jgi:hypothetical protein